MHEVNYIESLKIAANLLSNQNQAKNKVTDKQIRLLFETAKRIRAYSFKQRKIHEAEMMNRVLGMLEQNKVDKSKIFINDSQI